MIEVKIYPLLPQKLQALQEAKEICEVVCSMPECIEDFRWRGEPTCLDELTNYRKLSKQDKERFLEKNDKFFREGKIAGYLDQRDHVANKNKRNYDELKAWLKLDISVKARELVEKMLNTYSGRTPRYYP